MDADDIDDEGDERSRLTCAMEQILRWQIGMMIRSRVYNSMI
jgi:hypothetical protein